MYRILLTTLLLLSKETHAEEKIDPFDESRISFFGVITQRSPIIFNDEDKICKDRWFYSESTDHTIICGEAEYLEKFELSDLKYHGRLLNDSGLWALIVNNKNELVRVQVGNKIGRDAGVLKDIQDDFLVILEIVKADNDDKEKYNYIKKCNYILREGVDRDSLKLPEFP